MYWLRDNEAIDQGDIDNFEELKSYRNKLSHEMIQMVYDGITETYPENLVGLMQLRIKIERWWILNIEIPTNPDFSSSMEFKDENIQTPSQLFYKMLMDILTGDEETSFFYHKEFQKFKDKKDMQ